jgi:hypothetical protein
MDKETRPAGSTSSCPIPDPLSPTAITIVWSGDLEHEDLPARALLKE